MIFYDFFLFFVFLMYLPIMLVKGKGHTTLGERFGFIPPRTLQQLSESENIWIHAVSVGEVFAVRRMIKLMREHYRHQQIVLTVSTKTGYALAENLLKNDVVLLWAPIDLSGVVKVFIHAINPQIYIAVETEIWPNQFRLLSVLGIPTMVINGRISDRAWPRYRLFHRFFKKTLEGINYICVQSPLDAERFEYLGANPEKMEVVQSIKWDDEPSFNQVSRERFGLKDDDLIWVAGSTHPGEEEVLLDVYLDLLQQFPQLKLVLVPRHVERKEKIVSLIKAKGVDVVLFSKRGDRSVEQVLLVDQMGYLKECYALADIVFVGKSLRVGGGHNIIEPAYLGKPIVVGPMMENFKDVARVFLESDAVVQVKNDKEFLEVVRKILSDQQYASKLKEASREVVFSHQGATNKTLQVVKHLLDNVKR